MPFYFPHDTERASQSNFIQLLTQALKDKKHVLAHAPTGLGKTAASLSAALSHVLSTPGNNQVIFFITPKHTQHRIAIETLQTLKAKYKLDFSVVDLIGKRHLCAQPGAEDLKADFYEYCKNMTEHDNCTYYNNIKHKTKLSVETELVLKHLQENIIHVEELKTESVKHHVCPYEIACLHAKTCKVIIADYQHILSTSIRDNLFKRLNISLQQCIIIIDEGHNLLQKSRELLSTQLSTITLDIAAKEAAALGYPHIHDDLERFKILLETLAKQKISFENQESTLTKDMLIQHIKPLGNYDQLVSDLQVVSDAAREIQKKSYCGSVAGFLRAWQGPDDPFVRILKKGFNAKGKPSITLSYRCLDPAVLLQPIAQQCASFVAMSGTFAPITMYKDLIGIDALIAEFPNPFPKTNKLNLIVPDTTTKFTQRDTAMYERIARHCATVANNVPGNTLIFFPSYDLRDKVYTYLQSSCTKTMFLESPHLSKQEKNDLIEKFKQYKTAGAVLLGASTGNFGEGLDIRGNIVKCVIVVGLPLARPDLETQALIQYYDHKFKKGWDYGYTLPALIKGFQNAGRCIRSETDKGVIVYLDERYTWDSYFKCFPKDEQLRITKTPLPRIQEFFAPPSTIENTNLLKEL